MFDERMITNENGLKDVRVKFNRLSTYNNLMKNHRHPREKQRIDMGLGH